MRCHLKRVLTYLLTLVFLGFTILVLLDIQGNLEGELRVGYMNFKRDVLPMQRLFPGKKKPWRPKDEHHVWPTGLDETNDRVASQIRYVPDVNTTSVNRTKIILVFTGLGNVKKGRQQFILDECPVRNCRLTEHREEGEKADVVLFQNMLLHPRWTKRQNQIYVMFYLESPKHTPLLMSYKDQINWTATYRRDSTIVTPYERWTPYRPGDPRLKQDLHKVDYSFNKTRKVAWFVSNCKTPNGRDAYVEELQEYIQVDIYGSCGELSCPRNSDHECYDLLKRDYKFYLAFENSNCKDYITEKLYWNAYKSNVIPIVMGARPIDYKRSCPPNSYIHVDDFPSPKDLAEYLHKLDQNDDLYNLYFKWKGTGSFINTKFWCRLCAMAHDESRNSWYTDIDSWWRGGNMCISRKATERWATWREVEPSLNITESLMSAPFNSSRAQLNITAVVTFGDY